MAAADTAPPGLPETGAPPPGVQRSLPPLSPPELALGSEAAADPPQARSVPGGAAQPAAWAEGGWWGPARVYPPPPGTQEPRVRAGGRAPTTGRTDGQGPWQRQTQGRQEEEGAPTPTPVADRGAGGASTEAWGPSHGPPALSVVRPGVLVGGLGAPPVSRPQNPGRAVCPC